ncbi:hypothetical protein GMA10_04780 [Kocuria koreensis]|jgi:hypothetical protein|uniref:Uncharacterized protein n=1 Tax=Rothia koreensis TaxID=592378 RepID=A0A7K1LH67_9MICC|nr:hypothetical protein [Rothia koreensis]MUN54531.1 hypothetical protein [Rothia koreensis]
MSYLYPRLLPHDAKRLLARLERAAQEGKNLRPVLTSNFHPKLDWPATGGAPVSESHMVDLRHAMIDEVGDQTCADHRARREFDVGAGLVLLRWFEADGPANAADYDVWPFLSLIVMPDLAVNRFPLSGGEGGLQSERFLAGRRNVFYRAYLRALVLGDVIRDPDMELYEDELVGLIDRNLSMDHRLTRAIAREIANIPKDGNRRTRVRNGLKAIQYEMRVTDINSLSERALQEIIRGSLNRCG